MKIGTKVTLKENCEYKHQQVGVGTTTIEPEDGWVLVQWERGGAFGYPVNDCIVVHNYSWPLAYLLILPVLWLSWKRWGKEVTKCLQWR